MTEVHPGLARLREPFAPNQIGRKPKGGVQLEFVGHAALTDRLLEVDPYWSWEPFAVGEDGLPKFDQFGGLWMWLTICGVRRLGYGDADGKKGAVAVKEAIGDALRNGGMRFGAALDLWHKGDLHDLAAERDVPTDPVVVKRAEVLEALNTKRPARELVEVQMKSLGASGSVSECGSLEVLGRMLKWVNEL